jgi:DNA-binding transcriptional LysR family regulator
MPLLIQENYTARLAESLKRGDLDVIVVALPFEEPGIVTQAVYDEPFRVLMPAGHTWEADSAIPAARLAEAPLLLLGAGNCFRDQVLEVCPLCRGGEGLQRTLEGSSLETIRHMVATGAGITVLPSSAADAPARWQFPAHRASLRGTGTLPAHCPGLAGHLSPQRGHRCYPGGHSRQPATRACVRSAAEVGSRSGSAARKLPASVTIQSMGWSWGWGWVVSVRASLEGHADGGGWSGAGSRAARVRSK